jgi:hypothetical protein
MTKPPDGATVAVLTEAHGATYWVHEVRASGHDFIHRHSLKIIEPVLAWEYESDPHYTFIGCMERLKGASWRDVWRSELAKRRINR